MLSCPTVEGGGKEYIQWNPSTIKSVLGVGLLMIGKRVLFMEMSSIQEYPCIYKGCQTVLCHHGPMPTVVSPQRH